MIDKKKGIIAGIAVVVVMGIVGNLLLTPKTSDLQEQSASNQPQDVSVPIEASGLVVEMDIASTSNVVLSEPVTAATIALPTPPPELYLKPLSIDKSMAEYMQSLSKREKAEVTAATSELNAREWEAGQSKRDSSLGSSIGLDFSSEPVVTNVDSVIVGVEPTLTLRGISGTAREGKYAARLLVQGQFKRVDVGSKLAGYTVTRITKETVTLKSKQGVQTLALGESL